MRACVCVHKRGGDDERDLDGVQGHAEVDRYVLGQEYGTYVTPESTHGKVCGGLYTTRAPVLVHECIHERGCELQLVERLLEEPVPAYGVDRSANTRGQASSRTIP